MVSKKGRIPPPQKKNNPKIFIGNRFHADGDGLFFISLIFIFPWHFFLLEFDLAFPV